MKRHGLILAVLCLLFIVAAPPVQAQGRLAILSSSVKPSFPLSLSFSLTAESNSNINDIRLHYFVQADSFAKVVSEVYLDFTPASKVTVSWTWEMRRTGGLPPGTTVQYWWTVRDASNATVETIPASIQFDDRRYSWQKIIQGKVTILWYRGDQDFARELMAAANDTMAKLARDTGAELKKPVRIYIYASTSDLQGAMIFPQEWTGGVTYTRYSTIAIGISQANLAWGKHALTHEMSHQVVSQVTENPYSSLPTWLDEGLAMYNEGSPEPTFSGALNQAATANRLISVRSLSSPFSALSDQATLSYAESHSIVAFLINTYKQSKMLELLNTFRQGSTYDGALQKVYGFDLDGLNSLWLKSLGK